MSSGKKVGDAECQCQVQMTTKKPLSPASKMKRYRQRMKGSESLYTLYKEKEALRMKQFRLERKLNDSEELAAARKEKARVYMRERRAHIKDPPKKKHIQTCEGKEEQKKYWREKKAKSRAKRSSQKIRRTKEKDAEYRRNKRIVNNSARNESAFLNEDDFTTPEAKRKAAHIVCLCEYCTNIELMVKSINNKLKSASLKELPFTDKYEIVNNTLCPKGENEVYHRRACVERRCDGCGITKLKDHLKLFLQNAEKDVMSWKICPDYSEMGNGNRRHALLDKTGTRLHLIEELSKALDPFASHLHEARWQYRQFLDLQANLPQGWLLMVVDFAQNYTIEYQDEIQSAHWSKPQFTVLVHPVVTYYNCSNTLCSQENKVIRESVIIISSDINHDCHSVQTYVSAVFTYLTSDKEVEAKHIVQFLDGCGKQYKSITPFVDVSCSVSDFNCSLQRCFFDSRHGKGPCDDEGGVVKCAVSRAVACRQAVLRSATEFYKYCETNLTKQPTDQDLECPHSLRKFILVENVTHSRPKQSSFETLKGTMKLHEVSSTDGMGKIQTRNLSCFCPVCIHVAGTTEPCHNKSYVDNQKLVKLNRKTDILLAPVDNPVEIQQEERRPPSSAKQAPIMHGEQ